uniref:Uncharacterized protein n=1 Tax=Manihot esculenta TaxID=3983 RepID=A0A2C9UTW8_MANES
MAKENVTERNPIVALKRTCICSPTTHAGSFRSHLHRSTTKQKSAQPLVKEEDNYKKSKTSLSFKSIKIPMHGSSL